MKKIFGDRVNKVRSGAVRLRRQVEAAHAGEARALTRDKVRASARALLARALAQEQESIGENR